jgi:hypothetical protein
VQRYDDRLRLGRHRQQGAQVHLARCTNLARKCVPLPNCGAQILRSAGRPLASS